MILLAVRIHRKIAAARRIAASDIDPRAHSDMASHRTRHPARARSERQVQPAIEAPRHQQLQAIKCSMKQRMSIRTGPPIGLM
jgi:hypothetical protein